MMEIEYGERNRSGQQDNCIWTPADHQGRRSDHRRPGAGFCRPEPGQGDRDFKSYGTRQPQAFEPMRHSLRHWHQLLAGPAVAADLEPGSGAGGNARHSRPASLQRDQYFWHQHPAARTGCDGSFRPGASGMDAAAAVRRQQAGHADLSRRDRNDGRDTWAAPRKTRPQCRLRAFNVHPRLRRGRQLPGAHGDAASLSGSAVS